MSNETSFTADQAVRAQRAMRESIGEGPEQFPLKDFVAMVSDEIDALRARGQSDDAIAGIIREVTGKTIGAADLAEHYVPAEVRRFF